REPLAVSGRLARGLRRGDATPRLGEAVLVLTLATHPALLARHLDDFLHLELGHRELEGLRRAVVDCCGAEPEMPAEALAERLSAAGFGPLLDRLKRQVAASGAWQALPDSADSDADEGWRQALILHRRARALHKELKEAEAALASDGTAENLRRLIEIQNQLSNAEGIEAAIDGFGQPSGRQSQNY
ncbi:MAG: DNA primase, partial [Bauldia sp.]|nr:DNA primase [Bauldia sp.]